MVTQDQNWLDRQDVRAVVGTACRSVEEGVGDAHGVCWVHQVSDLGQCEPAHDGSLVGRLRGPGEGAAAKDQGDDSSRNVLVDPGEALDIDADAGLFQHFALDGIPVSDAERASLAWLCGFEAHTVEHLAAVIRRARRAER